jgi:uncharacterized protein
MKRTASLIFALTMAIFAAAQTTMRIYELPCNQRKTTKSAAKTTANEVKTLGVVTAILGDGFFLQDATGDGDNSTRDAIFVLTDTANIRLGNGITLTAFYSNDTLRNVSNLEKTADHQQVNTTKVTFPDDFVDGKGSNYVGMSVQIANTLTVTNNRNWNSGTSSTITLSNGLLMTPTEVALPSSSEYQTVVKENNRNYLILAPATSQSKPFADANGTLRTGYQVDDLVATVVSSSGISHRLQTATTPAWHNNERPTTRPDLGDCNLVVCAANLQYYLRSDFGTGYGPANETLANRQHAKIVKALRAIDADIYGLLEMQQGQDAIAYLCDAMNEAAGSQIYSYIDDGTSVYSSYTKSALIYRNDRVTPLGTLQMNNLKTYYRKLIQAFKLNENGEAFVLSLNHLKSKSGSSSASGSDQDQNDGQGAYNATRVAEAESIISKCAAQTLDADVLIMGDMNAYSMEDPVQKFVSAGYRNLLKKYDANAYSYVYNGRFGLLDHALGNSTMTAQVTGARVAHFNADEPTIFGYESDTDELMYRYSDHDAVVVGLNLGTYHDDTPVPNISDDDAPFVQTISNDGRLRIERAQGFTATVYDMLGRTLYTTKINNDCSTLSTADFGASGIVILQLKNESGKIFTQKILIK